MTSSCFVHCSPVELVMVKVSVCGLLTGADLSTVKENAAVVSPFPLSYVIVCEVEANLSQPGTFDTSTVTPEAATVEVFRTDNCMLLSFDSNGS